MRRRYSVLEITCCCSFTGRKKRRRQSSESQDCSCPSSKHPWLAAWLFAMEQPTSSTAQQLYFNLFGLVHAFSANHVIVWACLSFAALTGLLYQLACPLVLEWSGMPQLDPVITLWFGSCTLHSFLWQQRRRLQKAEREGWLCRLRFPTRQVLICVEFWSNSIFRLFFFLYYVFLLTLPLCCAQ